MCADRLISAEKLTRVFHMYRRGPRNQLSFDDLTIFLAIRREILWGGNS